MKTLKTFEEFNWFKRKELTPDEEYKKQEEEARKERDVRGKNVKKDLFIEKEPNKRKKSKIRGAWWQSNFPPPH
jgi:hypothetical protein